MGREVKQCQDREISLAVTEGVQPQQRKDYTHRWEMDLAELGEDSECSSGHHICPWLTHSLTALGRAWWGRGFCCC